jgi:hypothetical protein
VTAAYVSSAAAGVAALTAAITLAEPSGSDGDLLIAFCGANNATAVWTPPATGPAWTSGDAESAIGSAVFWRFTGVGDGGGTSRTFTRSGTGGVAGLIIARYSGVNAVAVSEVTNGPANTTLTIEAVTASVNNSTLVGMLVSSTTTADTWVAPGTGTRRTTAGSQASGTALPYAVGDEIVASGDTGTRVWTKTQTVTSRGAHIVLSPTSSPATGTGSLSLSGSGGDGASDSGTGALSLSASAGAGATASSGSAVLALSASGAGTSTTAGAGSLSLSAIGTARRDVAPPPGIAYGYQLYARQPATHPEIFVGGWPMSSIAPWGELHTVTRLTGDWEISWTMIRDPRKQLQRHHALVPGALVEVKIGPEIVAVGALTEPDWESGDMVAGGASREAEGAISFNASGETTTKPNPAIDQAISRGVLNWTRKDDFGSAAIGATDTNADLKSVARLLDAWAEDDDNPNWRVDRRRVLHAVEDDENDADWLITPGAGEMGAADDERIDRMFVRYLVSGGGGTLATASYPAASPAGGIERGADITNRGELTSTVATRIAKGVWRRMQGRSGWTNGISVNRSQVTSKGGVAANLALIKAGDSMRLLGVPDPRGLGHQIDVVIGETDYDWEAGTIQLNPVGLAARTFEAVLEAVSPGAVAL